ncbi:helix-turn-helix domain-containing protein [Microbacterium sp. NPDC091313]
MVTNGGDRASARWVAPEHALAAAELGARVQQLRSERGFSPQEFAALAAVSTAELAAVEAGDARVALWVLLTIAEALDLDAARLFEPADAAPTPAAAASAPFVAAPVPEPELAPLPPASWMPEPEPAPLPPAAWVREPEPAPLPQAVWVPEPEPVPQAVWVPESEPVAAAPAPAAPAPVAPAPPPPPARTPTGRVYVTRVGTAAAPAEPVAAAPARSGVPRTFADLRVGVLADRAFATLPQFAVAAVTEAGHAVSVVARIFRVPAWKLEGWVRDGVAEPPAQRTRQWT